jgi:hypothetical protein
MKTETQKFLEFNGKAIYFIAADGEYWIALKPICEALEVNWNRQFQNLKNDAILKAVFAKQQMQGPDGQLRNYISLPEFFIYGWIFQIQSNSSELLAYKWECYKLLYQHFHGMIGGRKDLLKEKALAQLEIDRVMNSLDPDKALKLQQAQKRITAIGTKLRQLDTQTIQEEKTLFSTP